MIQVPSSAAAFDERRPRWRAVREWARSLNRERLARQLALCSVGFFSVLVYVFVVSAGTFWHWPSYHQYVDMLAEGFRAGHLYLVQEPTPALLAKKNPLDGANVAIWIWDASYYRGHFYMYWGPVPACLLAFVKALFHIHATVGDEVTSFVFLSGRLAFGLLLLDTLIRRLFTKTPVWLAVAAALVFALGNPSPFVLARGGPYEVAITSAQCFLVAGLYFALRALVGASSVTNACALASTSWALAFGSRGSLLPATALLCVATLAALRVSAPGLRLVRPAVALALPPVIMLGCLVLYNYARFDSFAETGMNHQMSFRHFDTEALYVPLNLYSYLFRDLFYDCRFPFVTAPWHVGHTAIARWLAPLPGYFMFEPMGGALNSCPWILLGVFAVLATKRFGNQSIAPRVFCTVSFAIAATMTIAPALGLWMATMRYLLDFTSGATLLAAIGCFAVWERVADKALGVRLLAATPIIAFAAYSAALGVLLGFTGYSGHFQHQNPGLFQALQKEVSLCSR
jgi:hypothetical protein